MAPKWGGFFIECSKFTMSARTAIRHGVMRVLKMIVDVVLRWKPRADALPLAGVGVKFIRFPDIS